MFTNSSLFAWRGAHQQSRTSGMNRPGIACCLAFSLLAPLFLSACGLSSGAHVSPSQTKPSTSTRKENRLIHETSPYLLEHSHDPVDWYPWNDEAFKKAKSENKPILLSIGYSACHWCHVMHRESFQDQDTAHIMNQNFVNVKVDREERPDLDDIYMRAMQAMTGRGGWPATIFLTPDLKPFYAGTYFPKQDMPGMPSFNHVLTAVKQAWSQDCAKQNKVGSEVARIIASIDAPAKPAASLNADTTAIALEVLFKNFDTAYGGIGRAPKFPLPEAISLCMRATAGTIPENQRQSCLSFITTTLDKMAYGGIHDHISGGFCRYSTDREWHVPHFEKMLYDNALIAGNYLDGYLLTRKPYWAQTARDTLDFCLTELRSPEGAFFSSLDADSDGEEGAFYTFTQGQLIDALGERDARWFAQSFGVSPEGNFHARQNVLFLPDSPESLARRDGLSLTQYWDKVASLRRLLLAERNQRPRPRRDEKVIAAWNALMISSLVKGYKALGDQKYLDAAKQSAHFLLSNMYSGNRLHRTWASGRAKGEAFLDDYAFTVQALLDLAGTDFDPSWLKGAKELNHSILEHYNDSATGDFFYTADYQNRPLARTRSSFDSVLPSGTGVEIMNLCRLAQITGNAAYKNQAESLLKLYSIKMRTDPITYGSMLNALDYDLHSKTEIVLVAPSNQAEKQNLLSTICGTYAPNTNIVFFQPAASNPPDILLRSKLPLGDRLTVYLCHDMTCEKPITDPAALRLKLKQLAAEHAL